MGVSESFKRWLKIGTAVVLGGGPLAGIGVGVASAGEPVGTGQPKVVYECPPGATYVPTRYPRTENNPPPSHIGPPAMTCVVYSRSPHDGSLTAVYVGLTARQKPE